MSTQENIVPNHIFRTFCLLKITDNDDKVEIRAYAWNGFSEWRISTPLQRFQPAEESTGHLYVTQSGNTYLGIKYQEGDKEGLAYLMKPYNKWMKSFEVLSKAQALALSIEFPEVFSINEAKLNAE